MPIQKGGQSKRPAGKGIRKSQTPRPVLPRTRPGVPLRPITKPSLPGANKKRAEERTVRRQAFRQVANQIQSNKPRPVVRPVAPPRKVMVKAPNLPPRRKSTRPDRHSTGSRSTHIGTGIGTAATAAGLYVINTSNAHVDISTEVSFLQSSLTDLQNRVTFDRVRSEISEIENLINRVTDLLESARKKGYRYQSDMEEIAYSTLSRWQTVSPQLELNLQQQSQAMQQSLHQISPNVQRLNANLYSSAAAAPHIRSLQSQVNNLLSDVTRIENELSGDIQEISSQAYQLNGRLTDVHWALDQVNSARFELGSAEALVMAVPTRWDMEGRDDPEGVLYLTNERIIFERKEKVATKKVLFVTTASELVQEVLIDQKLDDLGEVKAESKGLFGHQDFLRVSFNDRKLGEVSFHINGQDSGDWASLIERAGKGQLENELVTGATGLSVRDLTRPLTNADIMALQSEVNALQDEMMLKGAQQELAKLENDVRNLERTLAEVRARGYSIEKDLEADVTVLSVQWDRVKSSSEKTISHQTKLLSEQMSSIQNSLAQLVGLSSNLIAARPVYMQVKSALASAEAQADAAEATVFAQYDEYADEVESLHAHLEWVEWMLEALSSASFKLLATESGVAAVEAVFLHPSWEQENGILYLTDQRLLWEDRVDTYELKLDVPLQQVLDVRKEVDPSSDQEILAFSLDSDAPVQDARFLLALDVADDWFKMVGRALSGGYVEDRAVKISEEELQRIRSAATRCPNCGAAFTAPILRGQTEIVCEYCGVITRI